MKTFIVWLLGNTLGQAVINTWRWLGQMSTAIEQPSQTEEGDQLAVANAQKLISAMSLRTAEIHEMLGKARTAADKIRRQYNNQSLQYQEATERAQEYYQYGNTIDARLCIAKSMSIERLLPGLQKISEDAEHRLIAIQKLYIEEQSRLALLEVEMENLKACIAMSSSIGNTSNKGTTNDLARLQQRFHDAQIEVEDRCQQIQLMSQLSQTSDPIIEEPLSDREIDDRLQLLIQS